jgi:uncharacterized membrane protein
MAAYDRPPGWSYNPSGWAERWPVLALGLTGFGIATYLGLYQLGVVPVVWEPLCGEGSQRILKESSIAHLLPVPDAILGAVVYLLDATLGGIGGRARWRTMPWIVLLLGLIAGALAVGGVLLAIFQPVLFHAYCTLCLASAACSILMVGFVMAEVLAALQFLKQEREQGRSAWQALRGRQAWHDPGDILARPLRSGGWSRATQVVNAALGIWLMAAPAVLGYNGAARTNDRIAGPVATACALIALHDATRSLRWVNLVLGAWLLIAPWVLGYELLSLLNSTVVGLLLVSSASVRGRSGQRLGGGWSSLWQTNALADGVIDKGQLQRNSHGCVSRSRPQVKES